MAFEITERRFLGFTLPPKELKLGKLRRRRVIEGVESYHPMRPTLRVRILKTYQVANASTLIRIKDTEVPPIQEALTGAEIKGKRFPVGMVPFTSAVIVWKP
jgi:hypothetical protein